MSKTIESKADLKNFIALILSMILMLIMIFITVLVASINVKSRGESLRGAVNNIIEVEKQIVSDYSNIILQDSYKHINNPDIKIYTIQYETTEGYRKNKLNTPNTDWALVPEAVEFTERILDTDYFKIKTEENP